MPAAEDDEPEQVEEEAPAPTETPGKRRLPKHFRPGGNTDPDHPYAKLLSDLSSLAGKITQAMADTSDPEMAARLKAYLTMPGLLVRHRAMIVGEKHFGAQFTGFRGIRRLIQLAGLPGRAKPTAAALFSHKYDQ